MSHPTPLGRTLNRYMIDRGYSLSRLARESGVSRGSIHHWLSGYVEQPYYFDNILRAAAALGLRRVQTNRLLRDAGLPSLAAIESGNSVPEIARLLERWQRTSSLRAPHPLTSFVGRQDEIFDWADLLADGSARLVTLTGPGGSGKTRLAIEIARELADAFEDGIQFVELTAVSEPGQLAVTILRAVGVREVAGTSPFEQLVSVFRDRNVLLVLDNFEQIVTAGPTVSALLRQCPRLCILVTSRSRLDASGEFVRRVEPLPLPEDMDGHGPDVRSSPAVSLFIERAEATGGENSFDTTELPSVVEICRWLDGLPLAIELAAARSRSLRVEDLRERFQSRLDLSAAGPRDAARRQRTLRATIEWSYDLLDPNERRLFASLAAFRGGWTTEDAKAVFATDLNGVAINVPEALEALERANLVRHDPETGRWSMLETIREYATETLDAAAEVHTIRRRHARLFLSKVDNHPPYIPTAQPGDWQKIVSAEHDNFRQALAWSERTDRDIFTRIAVAIWPFWHLNGYWSEGLRWLRELESETDRFPGDVAAEVLTAIAFLLTEKGQFDEALPRARRAVEAWAQIGSHYGLATVLEKMGWIQFTLGIFDEALQSYQECLSHWDADGDPLGIAAGHMALVGYYIYALQVDQATPHFDFAYQIYQQHGDQMGLTLYYSNRGVAALVQEDVRDAIHWMSLAVRQAEMTENQAWVAACLFFLGYSYCLDGDPERALDCQLRSCDLRRESGDILGLGYNLLGFAAIASRLAQFATAARLCGAAESTHQRGGIQFNPLATAVYSRETSTVRASLCDEDFIREFMTGSAMSLNAALDLAFNLIDP